MVAVTLVPNEMEAEVACGLLRANGIECGYRQTSVGAGSMDGMRGGQQEILVAEADEQRARELLRSST